MTSAVAIVYRRVWVDDTQSLRERIERGDRLFPEDYRALLEGLKAQMGFTLRIDYDQPILNKLGKSEHWIRIQFLG